jgi:glucosamine--fructose-6-phosphate aminotransferase (isomerizing)
MDKVRKAGARTVGITNDPDSPLATVSDAVIDIDAGAELAVPATKTFTAQLAALCLLAEAIGPTPWTTEAWERLPAGMQDVLAHTAFASATAEAIRGDGILCVARGYLLCVALEAALKIKETSGLLAQGYSAADLRHGPLAAVAESFPVLTFTARGQTQGDMNDLGSTLRAKGARVLKVHDGDDADFPIPEGLPEPFLCIVMAAAAQQIAHALALHRGLDPDSPRGLTKVTPTR